MKSTSENRIGILIVDDEPDVLGYLVSILGTAGYDCHTAHTTEEALQVLKDHPKDRAPLIAIVDLVLGAENGMSAAEALVRAQPDLRILMISGYADNVVSKPLPNGFPPVFLTKPFSATQLRQELDRLKSRKT